MNNDFTLQTERLILRPFQQGDGVFMFKNWASDSAVTKYLRHAPHKDVGVSNDIVEMYIEDFGKNDSYKFCICEINSNEPIGSINIHVASQFDNIGEFGYYLSKEKWNKGYITEALQAVLEFGFSEMNLNRIEACHSIDNKASGRVMQKVGMKYEGLLRDGYKSYLEGYQDCCLYSILKKEYKRNER